MDGLARAFINAWAISKRRKVAERSNAENDSPYVYLKCPRNRKRRFKCSIANYPTTSYASYSILAVRYTVLFSEVTLDRNYASILSARDAQGRSGPHVERI